MRITDAAQSTWTGPVDCVYDLPVLSLELNCLSIHNVLYISDICTENQRFQFNLYCRLITLNLLSARTLRLNRKLIQTLVPLNHRPDQESPRAPECS